MPVAAGVVGDLGMAARRVLAARDMAAERRRATALDRTHHLQLVEAHMPAVGLTPSRTVVAENVRDLQSWSSHGRQRYGCGFRDCGQGFRLNATMQSDRRRPPVPTKAAGGVVAGIWSGVRFSWLRQVWRAAQ